MSYENDPKNQPTQAGEQAKNFFVRVWEYLKAAKLEYIILASFFVVDLVSKALVAGLMREGQSITIIPYILSFTYSANENAAFGSMWMRDLFNGNDTIPRVLFCVFAAAASAVFLVMLYRSKGGNRVFRAGLAMLTAGALGNMIDRMFLGYVRDFIDMKLFTLMTGGLWVYIFNIADCALVIGVILVIVYFLFLYETEERKARKAARRAAKAAAKGNIVNAVDANPDENVAATETDAVEGDGENTEAPSDDGNTADSGDNIEKPSGDTEQTEASDGQAQTIEKIEIVEKSEKAEDGE